VYNSANLYILEKIVRARFVLFLVVAIFILSACGGSNQPAAVTAAPPATDTAVPLPTLTASPVVPLAILVLPATLDKESSDLYQKTVYDLAQASGMRFQVRNSLSPADLEPGLQVVVALPPDPGIAALAAAAPRVQFLAINMDSVTAGGNVSVLANGSHSEIAGFLAGYTAALITEDYRIGMMLPKDNPDAAQAAVSFRDGMTFYCGTCRPVYFPPFCIAENLQACYPQTIEIPKDEDKAKYGPYADYLIVQRKVQTLFLYPDVATPDLETYIGTTGALMIGTQTPESLPAGWVMTIQPDVVKAIQNAWPQLVAGKGGQTVQSPLGLSDIDSSLLSAGKQRLVEKMLDDLQTGYVSP
jgi:hypothetical protein